MPQHYYIYPEQEESIDDLEKLIESATNKDLKRDLAWAIFNYCRSRYEKGLLDKTEQIKKVLNIIDKGNE